MKQNGIALMVLMLSLVALTMSSASADESGMAVPVNRKLMNQFPLTKIIMVGELGQGCLRHGAWCGFQPQGHPPCCPPYTCQYDANIEETCN